VLDTYKSNPDEDKGDVKEKVKKIVKADVMGN
jgi:hypothetical protein